MAIICHVEWQQTYVMKLYVFAGNFRFIVNVNIACVYVWLRKSKSRELGMCGCVWVRVCVCEGWGLCMSLSVLW